MSNKQVTKLTYAVNTWLLFIVILMAAIFYRFNATFLVYFSIPTAAVYIINYYFIYKNWLTTFVRLVYFWITIYMGLTTIGLGYGTGFHLYALSMIPVVFCTEYMAYNMNKKSVNAAFISIAIIVIYLISAGYAVINGAIYPISESFQVAAMIINAIIVCSFLVTYSTILIKLIVDSEEKLKKMALLDKLTGLYNRYYMIEKLGECVQPKDDNPAWIAMIDMDDFKKINDTYGHNAGDYVLVKFSRMLEEICAGCVSSRWGGEEYLILANENTKSMQIMEQLRKAVADEKFEFEGKTIPVSITVGVAVYQDGMTMDAWIQEADKKLYQGKKNGKNVVIW